MTVSLSLFAGVGVGIALDKLGIPEYGVENARDVTHTRDRLGMTTLFPDAWDGAFDMDLVPEHDLQVSSPPCQAFSTSGTKAGHDAMAQILGFIADGSYREPNRLARNTEHLDSRIGLVLLPLLYAMRDLPATIVLEQVPSVLPIWRAYAAELTAIGYSVWTGVLGAETFGIPQTRRRAILLASRDGKMTAPKPTHSKYHVRRPHDLDPGMPRWQSMADVLGGPAGYVGFPRLADDMGEAIELNGVRYRERDLRSTNRPAFVVTSKVRSWRRWTEGGAVNRLSVDEAAVLQSFPAGLPWQGSMTSQFLQVANAFPPMWAKQLISHALEAELT